MLETLLGTIFIGSIIMACLFFYWLKYIYVEKDDKDIRSRYSPLTTDVNIKNNNDNNQTLYKVDQNFINKKKSKNK